MIAEIKRRSPSKGELAGIADPASLAAQYADGGAAVISVLTEERRFGGSLADLDAVRAAVDIPLLRKDFMVDEYQIWEARAHGADLILLIVASLSDAQLREFRALSRELGMNVLVETHTRRKSSAPSPRRPGSSASTCATSRRSTSTVPSSRRSPAAFPPVRSWSPSPACATSRTSKHYAASGANAVLVGEALVSDATPRERIAEFMAAGAAAIAARA